MKWLESASLLTMLAAAPAFARPATQTTPPPTDSGAPSGNQAPDLGTQAATPGGQAAPPDPQATAPEEQTGIRDIIVTAQRRAERIQDVPIAISAFSADQLQAQGVQNTLQLGNYVPNLVALNNTGIGSANAYFLRGLGNTETIATFDPPVGTYVDDIYISRQNANNLSLFDVERVEVLRGPQGTLFGRNTTGGAINVIMRKPGDEFGGYAEAGFGSYGRHQGRASVDVPLAPGFAIKVSGYYQNDDGFAINTTTGERMNDDDGWGARLGIRGDLAPNVRWNAAYMHIEANGENILNFDCDPRDPSNCDGRFLTTGLREENGPPSPYAPLAITGRKANFGQNQRAASELVTSNLEVDLNDDTTVNFITGFISLTQRFALDFFDGRGGPTTAVPVPPSRGFQRGGFTILNDGYHEQLSQEVKVNGELGDGLIDYVVGGFYLRENNRTDFADVFTVGLPNGSLPLLLADRTLRNVTQAYAGYVQADLNVTDQITLTAGVRYTDETKSFSFRDNRASCNDGTLERTCLSDPNLIAPSGVPIPREQNVKIWTPRFAVNFKPNNDLLLFASATRGFKSGGWNARGTAPNQLLPFDPERVWSYEAGVKSDLFDRRVRANVTMYWLDTTELQTPSALVAPNGSITFITRNFADYENKGVELELSFQPVEGFNLYANAGYQDDRYKIDGDAPAFDIYGIQSVPSQQAACQAQRAANQIPTGANTAPAGQPPNNAPACAAGIVDPFGNVATPVRTPDWTLSIGGSYRAELGGGVAVTPTVNASYRSDQEVGTSNLSFYDQPVTGVNGTFPSNPFGDGGFIVGSESEAVWLVNAGISVQGYDNRLTVSLECTNCLDEEWIASTLANYSYLNEPRRWLVRTRFNF